MLVWLLDLDIGGRRLYLSSNPVHYSGRFYSGTLDAVSFTDALDGVGDTPSDRTASLNAVLDTSLGTLLAQGHDFTTGRATLTLWHTNEPEHRALTVLRDAFVSQPEVGDEFEPVSFNITQRILDDTAIMLNPTAKVDQDTMGSLTLVGIGQSQVGGGNFYPMVLGRPSGDVNGRTPGSPAYAQLAQTDLNKLARDSQRVVDGSGEQVGRLILSGHNPNCPDEVAVYYSANGGIERLQVHTASSLETFPIRIIQDDLGNYAWVVDYVNEALYGAAPSADWVDPSKVPNEPPDAEFWIKWPETMRGARNMGQAGYVDTIRSLIVHLASKSSLPYDIPSIQAALAKVPGQVGWYIADQSTPSELISQVVEALPLSAYNGPNGITFVRVDSDLPPERCIALVDGLNCWRDGPLRLTRNEDEAVGQFVVKYGPTGGDVGFQGSVSVSQHPRDFKNSTPWSVLSPRNNNIEEVEIPWTYDESTAVFIAKWLARKYGFSPRIVSVRVGQELARSLTPGSPVAFTDSSVGLSEAVGIVTSREMTDLDFWTLELSFYPSTASLATETPAGSSSVGTPVASGT